jgi:hypothetical protein
VSLAFAHSAIGRRAQLAADFRVGWSIGENAILTGAGAGQVEGPADAGTDPHGRMDQPKDRLTIGGQRSVNAAAVPFFATCR